MISLEWVSDYIDIAGLDPKELAKKITEAGINIEKVISNHIDNLVIGKVLECSSHPNSDHLHVCKVDVGTEIKQIVCGASNVREGLTVIVALPGAILPGNVEIKKSKIRDVESEGMICALFELGLEEKTEENYNKGIYEGDATLPIGEDALKALGLDSTLYELDIHKHRNNDCYYHIGFAYEIAAILNKKVTLPELKFTTIKENIKDHFSLKVETKRCPYYLARMVKDVEIKQSPKFIQKRLIEAGMRPINNVVDISNYVMLEFGQPLHFFDKDKLGNKIIVRDAKENETITTLDHKDRILNISDIVITDGDHPVCIAGVMGGLNTDVDENTKNILIESAIFDSVSIRNTSNRLNLRSEASIRYGKGLSYEYTNMAIDRACYLLEKYANAKILEGTLKHDETDKTPKTVTFKAEEINNLLGITIDTKDMEVELNRLDFPYTLDEDTFTVTIPSRRLDIDPNVNDIAEEIGRLYGYHNLTSTLPNVPIKKGEYIGDVAYRKFLSKRLRAYGLNETKTYTLVSPEMAAKFTYEEKEHAILPNPMSVDKSVVRTTLIPSLINVYQYNKARKVENIFLYEVSKVYDKNYEEDSKVTGLLKGNFITNSWKQENMKVDFYVVKGMVEDLLDSLGFHNRYSFEKTSEKDLHPGISANILLDRKPIGIIGRVHPNILKDEVYVFELSLSALMSPVKPIKYKEAPKYPSIEKDVAFVVKKDISASDIIAIIKKKGGRLLGYATVFDVYTGSHVKEDEKSLAFKLTFMDPTRTLTDEEVMAQFHTIIEGVTKELQATLRDF